jgi:hypothetical protein
MVPAVSEKMNVFNVVPGGTIMVSSFAGQGIYPVWPKAISGNRTNNATQRHKVNLFIRHSC